jgi:hypothetical protein
MNDSSNPGADFHCDPNSIIKLKGEDVPQPRNGAPTTSDAYVSQLRTQTGELFNDGVVNFTSTNRNALQDSGDAINLGTGEFTVEAFVYHSDIPQNSLQYIFMNSSQSNTTTFAFAVESDRIVAGAFAGSFSNSTKVEATFPAGSLKTGKWYHYAACRSGNTLRLFIDGRMVVEDTSHTENYNNTSAFGCRVGCEAGAGATAAGFKAIKGFISNVRVVNGTALYTSNFTPPTSALTAVTNTVLLCCQSPSSPTAAAVSPGTLSVLTEGDGLTAGRNELDASIVLAVPGISTTSNPDLVTNGNFSVDSNWEKSSQWTISGGSASMPSTGSYQPLYQYNLGLIGGTLYVATVDVTAISGTVKFGTANSTGGGIGGDEILISATGSYRYTFTADAEDGIGVARYEGTTSSVTIDNIKVVALQTDVKDYSADIKGSGTNKTLTATGNAGVGYEIPGYYGSAMTFDNDGTNASGNTDVINVPTSSDFVFGGDVTMECWIYPNATPTNGAAIIGQWQSGGGTNRNFQLNFNTSSQVISYFNSGGTNYNTGNSPVLALNQWHHIAVEKYGSVLTLYVNGVAVGVGVSTPTAGNTSTVPFTIGSESDGSNGADYGFNGLIQDVRVYKGLAKYKGGFDVPKPYTPVGIEAFRTTADTCKNNFMTMSPLSAKNSSGGGLNLSLSDGNLTVATDGTANQSARGSFIVSSGKWYFETTLPSATGLSSQASGVGVVAPNIGGVDGSSGPGYAILYRETGGAFLGNGSSRSDPATGTHATYVAGDIIGVALDIDNGDVEFFKNGVSAATYNFPAHAVSGTNWTIESLARQGDSIVVHNFGQNPTLSGSFTAGTNADDSGKGLFKYAPPTGFLALCGDNLPAPAIADPGKYFKSVLYTGNGVGGHSVTGVGFKPDFVWLKGRDGSSLNHILNDVIRGPKKTVFTNNELLEYTDRGVNSFDEDGFSLSSSGGDENANGEPYVAWCWKAGGAAVLNTDGTITSQVSANQDAGFSIAAYSGSTGNYTFGHGLGIAPKFVMIKNRSSSSTPWFVMTNASGSWEYGDMSSVWGGAAAQSSSSSVIDTNNNVYNWFNQSGNNYIAYSWAEIEGFSKISSYVGNGNNDGPFVYCGFKPAWVLIKKINGSGNENWRLLDSSRCPTNQNNKHILPVNIGPETTETGMDFLSNGFKLRDDDAHQNQDGTTYIFMAFAESPFQTANAK